MYKFVSSILILFLKINFVYLILFLLLFRLWFIIKICWVNDWVEKILIDCFFSWVSKVVFKIFLSFNFIFFIVCMFEYFDWFLYYMVNIIDIDYSEGILGVGDMVVECVGWVFVNFLVKVVDDGFVKYKC